MSYLVTSLENEVKRTLRKYVDGYNLGATFNSQKKITCTKESKEVTNKEEEMKWSLSKCKIWICEIIIPNKTFNRHNLESSIIRRPRARMQVKNKL